MGHEGSRWSCDDHGRGSTSGQCNGKAPRQAKGRQGGAGCVNCTKGRSQPRARHHQLSSHVVKLLPVYRVLTSLIGGSSTIPSGRTKWNRRASGKCRSRKLPHGGRQRGHASRSREPNCTHGCRRQGFVRLGRRGRGSGRGRSQGQHHRMLCKFFAIFCNSTFFRHVAIERVFSGILGHPIMRFVSCKVNDLVPTNFTTSDSNQIRVTPPSHTYFVLVKGVHSFPGERVPSAPRVSERKEGVNRPHHVTSFRPRTSQRRLVSLVKFHRFVT